MDENYGHLMLENWTADDSSLVVVQLEQGIGWFVKCKCFFFFISYNEWEGKDTGTSAYSGTTLSEVGEFRFFY